jgi:hypothetical protein
LKPDGRSIVAQVFADQAAQPRSRDRELISIFVVSITIRALQFFRG